MIKEIILDFKLWSIIAGVAFALIILLGIAGNVFGSKLKENDAQFEKLKVFMLGNFEVSGLCAGIQPMACRCSSSACFP